MSEDSKAPENWSSKILNSPFKSKFFSLIPFFVESRLVTKYFVLRMELFPNAEYLKMHILRLGGVYEIYVPIK